MTLPARAFSTDHPVDGDHFSEDYPLARCELVRIGISLRSASIMKAGRHACRSDGSQPIAVIEGIRPVHAARATDRKSRRSTTGRPAGNGLAATEVRAPSARTGRGRRARTAACRLGDRVPGACPRPDRVPLHTVIHDGGWRPPSVKSTGRRELDASTRLQPSGNPVKVSNPCQRRPGCDNASSQNRVACPPATPSSSTVTASSSRGKRASRHNCSRWR